MSSTTRRIPTTNKSEMHTLQKLPFPKSKGKSLSFLTSKLGFHMRNSLSKGKSSTNVSMMLSDIS